jgi:hypothetical protein
VSYGIEITGPSGSKVIGQSHMGILFRAAIQIPAGNGTWVWSYPEHAGRTAKVLVFDGMYGDTITPAWTYPGGVPTLTIVRQVSANFSGTSVACPAFIYIQ